MAQKTSYKPTLRGAVRLQALPKRGRATVFQVKLGIVWPKPLIGTLLHSNNVVDPSPPSLVVAYLCTSAVCACRLPKPLSSPCRVKAAADKTPRTQVRIAPPSVSPYTAPVAPQCVHPSKNVILSTCRCRTRAGQVPPATNPLAVRLTKLLHHAYQHRYRTLAYAPDDTDFVKNLTEVVASFLYD